jgi:hypothetical protein
MPSSIHPNTITIAGTMVGLFGAVFVLAFSDETLTKIPPNWVFFAATVFLNV